MTQTPIIVFVCEHGSAKSVIAATYFNKLANEKGLNLQAIARGTHPDQELSPKTVTGLLEDGLTPAVSVPQQLLPVDVESAQQIITFCELPVEFQGKTIIKQWENVPPVSENYEHARNVIIEHLNQLLVNLS